ncbi:MAG: V-type ATP synthase subunit F [Clostridia bacterium]
MRNNKIAVIGDKDSILAFKAVGADVFPVKNEFEASDTLKLLARSYAIIFITEDIAKTIENIIDRYKNRPYPAVIPIPNASGSTGFGLAGISKNVEKALGVDIFANK